MKREPHKDDRAGVASLPDELQRSEEQLRRSLAAARAGTWEWDLTTGENVWSDELWHLYGLEREGRQASYEAWLESVRPEDRPWLTAYVAAAVADGLDLDFRWRVHAPAGSLRWLHSRGTAERGPDGAPLRYRGVVMDVTDLKATQELLALTLDNIADGVLVLDKDWRSVYVNTSAERLLRASAQDVLGREVWEVFESAAGTLLESEYRRAAAGELREFDYFHEPWSRWFHNRCLPREDGGLAVYFEDITDQRRSLLDLQEREAAYGAIFRGSPYAMALMTEESLVIDANQAFFDMIGATRDQVVGRSVVDIGVADARAVGQIAARLRREGAVRDLELIRTTLTGAPLVVSLNLSPVTIAGADHVLAIYRDITDRKLAEQAVQESRAKLEAALSSMTDAVFISDADGTFVDFNDAFAAFHRFTSRDECLRTLAEYPDILEVYLPEGEPAPLDQWAVPRALRGESVVDAEYGLRRKDTGERWIGRYSFSPIRDEHGCIVGSVVVARDVTERKEAERAVAESELKFRSLFEHSSLGVFLTTPEGEIETANPAAQAMLGYTEEELRRVGRGGVLDRHDPRLAAALEERRLAGRLQAVELTAVRKDGEHFPVEVDSTIMPGSPDRSFVMMRDISRRKVVELALQAREAEAREILDRLSQAQALGHMGDWAWDVRTGRVSWSPEVYRVFGLGTDAETTFDSIVPLIHTDDRAPHLHRVEKLVADPTKMSGALAFRIVRPNGEEREINQTFLVERDEQGVALRMYGLMQDVTELRRAEQALVQSEARLRRLNLELEDRVEVRTEQLKKANEELEAFSYSVSHDLRAPLRHISGYSQLLAEHLGEDLDDEARHFVDTIVASAREMGDLIDDLLQLSRLGRADMHAATVDMAHCVREVLEPLAAESGARVTVCVGELPPAHGDRTLLRQVWANLLGNAFKYTRPRETPEVEVGALEEDGATVYYVRDNGVGFDMAYIDQLFAVFQRLHSSAEFEGTGVGLATVRRIVERHGGRVWAQATPNEGATFFFTIPGHTGGAG